MLVTVVAMIALGIVSLFSASAFALSTHDDVNYFVWRQAAWIVLGSIACVILAATDYHLFERFR